VNQSGIRDDHAAALLDKRQPFEVGKIDKVPQIRIGNVRAAIEEQLLMVSPFSDVLKSLSIDRRLHELTDAEVREFVELAGLL
jgi:hypothetical protein